MRLGEPGGGILVAQGIISACWVVFCLFWVIRARSAKATAERQSMMGRLAHLIPLALGVLMGSVTLHPLGIVLLRPAELRAPLGAGLCALGLAGAIWSRQSLADNWSGLVTFKEGHELVVRGPYRLVRHPIYSSLLLMVLGSAIARGTLAVLAGFLLFCLAFGIKIVQEEKLLLRHFPDTYPAYRSRVKALVPFVF
jgi:protein-S-isoprenylcysteine O-methyltransferase Ste14